MHTKVMEMLLEHAELNRIKYEYYVENRLPRKCRNALFYAVSISIVVMISLA